MIHVVLDGTESAEVLHHRVEAYNWNDGFQFPLEVLRHSRCDRGTAFLLFWLAEPYAVLESHTGSVEASGEHLDFLTEARERLLAGRFASSRIQVTVQEATGGGMNKLGLLKLRRAAVPKVLYETTPGAPVSES